MNNGRMLRLFLADRTGVALLAYGIALAILVLTSLLLSFSGLPTGAVRSNVGYGLLLATAFLAAYLLVDLLRWWPHARQAQTLLEWEVDLMVLSNLPSGGTLDQRTSRDLLAKLHSVAVAEKLRYEEAHRRHLAFMNLWVHQMKTPVSAINLIAQEVEEQAPTAMQSVEEETARLAEGLEMVLTMARLQDFAIDFHIRRVDLLEGVRSSINARKKQFIRLGIFPEVAADGEDWTILTDSKWNGFVLDQIISNALKYGAQAQGAEPTAQRLRFRLARNAGAICLTIADEGPGIPAQDLPRVFEPFFTGENGRRFAGATGVGLWLVHQVVDRLGHQIAVESAPGQGTTVTLCYLTKV